MPENENNNQTKRKKKIRRAFFLLLVIALTAAVNLCLSREDYSIDVSQEKIYTLSQVTLDLLGGLEQEVTIYVMGEEKEMEPASRKILEEYTAASPKVQMCYCSRDSWDRMSEEYGIQENSIEKDSILVVGGGRSQFISSGDYITYDYTDNHNYEAGNIILEQLTSEAIRYVNAPEKTAIYFLTGHGEKEPVNNLVNVLEGRGYQVSELELKGQESVPGDCSVLVINGYSGKWTHEEFVMIKTYMAAGGKIYLFVDPTVEKQPAVESLLEDYGLKLQRGVVVEKDPARFSRYEIYLIPEIRDTEVTAGLVRDGEKIIMPSTRAIAAAAGAGEGENQLTLYLVSSESSYSKVDLDSTDTDKEKKDIDGPFALSVGVSDQTGGRLIVTGCVNMLEDNVNRASGGANMDFVVNGLEYLSRKEGSMAISGKNIRGETALVPAFDQKIILVSLVFLLPMLIFGAGILVTERRKRR